MEPNEAYKIHGMVSNKSPSWHSFFDLTLFNMCNYKFHLLLGIFILSSSSASNLIADCLLQTAINSFGDNRYIVIMNCDIRDTHQLTASLKHLHAIALRRSLSYELTDGRSRITFPSFQRCIQNCHLPPAKQLTKYHYKRVRKAELYLIFIDDATLLQPKLQQLETMSNYNISAELLIVYTGDTETPSWNFTLWTFRPNHAGNDHIVNMADHLLQLAYEAGHYFAKLLIPFANGTTVAMYTYDLYATKAKYCAAEPQLVLLNHCNGRFANAIFRIHTDYTRLNCTLRAVLMRIPPFIISRTDGLEIRLLKEIARRMNITFDAHYHDRSIEDWGAKQLDGSWSGLLHRIHADPFNLGVGAISLRADRLEDFDYSNDYFSEKMAWIVPTAKCVPQWRTILAVFAPPMWATLLAVLLLVAAALHLQTSASNALLDAIQISLSVAVARQPRDDGARITFLTYALFIIIVNCIYQSFLINVLTDPLYEHQIDSYDEVIDSDLRLGGIQSFRHLFNETDNTRAMVIYDKYVVFADDRNTMYYWMMEVTRGDTITILGEFYAKYHSNLLAGSTPKIYIVKDVVYADVVRMIFSKGFVLKTQMNDIITGVVHSGLIEVWKKYYLTKRSTSEQSTSPSNKDVVLTIKHYQGAFLFLIAGCLLATCTFLSELLLHRFLSTNLTHI